MAPETNLDGWSYWIINALNIRMDMYKYKVGKVRFYKRDSNYEYRMVNKHLTIEDVSAIVKAFKDPDLLVQYQKLLLELI
jgi:ferredoxin-fold anticodon binding domain-containing protein